MITAHVARVLAGENNENFKTLLKEIQEAALRKNHDFNIILSHPPYRWIQLLGFDTLKEVLTSFGYKVFDNTTSYKIRW